MKKSLPFFSTALLMLLFLTHGISQDYTLWDGYNGDDWFDETNWSDGLPNGSIDVIIPAASYTYPVVYEPAECNAIFLEADEFGPANLLLYDYLEYSFAGVDTYIKGGRWQMISSPLQFQWLETFYLNGSPEVYVTRFDEPTNSYVYLTDLNYELEDMTGYMIWVDGGDQLFTYYGFFNEGYYEKTDLTRTSPGENSGWHMVGNPYPCAIDWDADWAWYRENIDPTIYIYNNGNWASYNINSGGVNGGDYLIAPGQGFFVNVSDGETSGTIGIWPDAQINEVSYFLKDEEVVKGIKLQAAGNNRTDETILRFDDGATTGFDSDQDAYKMFSSNPAIPQIYTKSDVHYAINVLPSTPLVPLYFQCGTNGEYEISVKGTDQEGDLWMEDLKTNAVVNLKDESYTFEHSTLNEPDRFLLHFSPVGIADVQNKGIQINALNNQVVIQSREPISGSYILMDMQGRLITQGEMSGNRFDIPVEEPGNYIIRLQYNGNVLSKKFFIL
jgi:hypothetical protein